MYFDKISDDACLVDTQSGCNLSGIELKTKSKDLGKIINKVDYLGEKRTIIIIKDKTLWIKCLVTLNSLNSCIVPIDENIDRDELKNKIKLSQAHYLITDDPQFITKENGKISTLQNNKLYLQQLNLEEGVKHNPYCSMMIFTSGTGGKEKLVMLSETAIQEVVNLYKSQFNGFKFKNILCVLPLSAIYPITICLAGLQSSKRIIFADPLTQDIKQINKEYSIHLIPAVPLLLEKIHENIFNKINSCTYPISFIIKTIMNINLLSRIYFHINIGKLTFYFIHNKIGKSIQVFLSGGATLNTKITADLYKLGFTILEGYGLTETAGVICIRDNNPRYFGALGKPLNNINIRFKKIDSGINILEVNTKQLMLGYYNAPSDTIEVLQNGWLNTGDIVYQQSGNLYLNGRYKDIIVMSDETKIPVNQIESYLTSVMGKYRFALCGISRSDKSGDKICLFVEDSNNGTFKKHQKKITTYIQKYDSRIRIDEIVIIDKLPRNKLGKVIRSKLKIDYCQESLNNV